MKPGPYWAIGASVTVSKRAAMAVSCHRLSLERATADEACAGTTTGLQASWRAPKLGSTRLKFLKPKMNQKALSLERSL